MSEEITSSPSRFADANRLFAFLLTTAGCAQGQLVVEGGEKVQVVGKIDGQQMDDGFRECVWIVDSSENRRYLFLRDDVTVKFDPVRLIDPSGSVIARGGDMVIVVGTQADIGDAGCGEGAAPFLVDQIATAG